VKFPVILIAVSILIHSIFFGYPKEVVFDEVHNGKYISAYSTGSYYFDVHPPLGRLLMHFFAKATGASATVNFVSIGNEIPMEIVLLRLIPLIAGILLPIIIYFICLYLGMSKWSSFLVGLLVCFENSLIVQSRFILFDSIMLFFGFLSILLYLIYVDLRKNSKRSIYWYYFILILSVVFSAGAFSIKWTGLAFPLLIIILEIIMILKSNTSISGQSLTTETENALVKVKRFMVKVKKFSGFFLFYAITGIVIYFIIFAIHFSYLAHSGTGDSFMSNRFQKTLVGNRYVNNSSIQAKGFWGKIIELNIEMYIANTKLTTKHDYSSAWYSWPVMLRPIFYWQSSQDTTDKTNKNIINDGRRAYIYLLGNPFIYWLGTVSIILLFLHFLYFLIYRKKIIIDEKIKNISTFILIGYLVNFIPFVFIGRVMFLYHYETALIFSIIAVIFFIDSALILNRRKKIIALSTLVGICFITFIFFSPLTYGFRITDRQLLSRIWFSSWR